MDRLPGFRDFYPDPVPHQDLWSASARAHLFGKWREAAARYGFEEYDGPPIEALELYTLKSGAEIVGQLYNFVDKGERAVSLRPEMTPTLARMAAAHARNYKKPLKWFAIPQLFRYERQQKGRLREHFQWNADIIGESGPGVDAELIALLIDSLRGLGLGPDDFRIRLSSRNAWQQFFQQRCSDPALEYAFYQVIDKLEREAPEHSEAQLAKIGISFQEVRGFIDGAAPSDELRALVGELEARGLGAFVKIDYNVIRGLAYYTGVVFEAFDRAGSFRAIAGGGRYDNLLKLISGGKVDLPAAGFGMGDVVLTEILKERGLLPKGARRVEVFVAVEEESWRAESLRLIQALREGGMSVDHALCAQKADKQFKRAVELNARFLVRLVRRDPEGTGAAIKELATRQERTVAISEVIGALKSWPEF